MRKIFTLCLFILLIVSFTACDLTGGSGSQTEQPIVTAPTSEPTAPQTEPHEHSYTAQQTKAPGCEDQGEMTYTCACGHSYAEPIASIGHTYTSAETKLPGCEEHGEITYTCSCGHSYTEPTDPTGHNWGNWFVNIEPTFTTTGEEMRMCTVCQQTETQELKTNGIEEELQRIATLGSTLPVFQSVNDLSAADIFNWVRIQAGWVSSNFDDTTFQVTNVYSLDEFDAVTLLYFGRTFDFVNYAERNDEMSIDAASNQLIWITYGAGGWHMTAMDSYTKTDDTHYSIRYFAYDYDNVPVHYGTLNVRLTDQGFVIESHTTEG